MKGILNRRDLQLFSGICQYIMIVIWVAHPVSHELPLPEHPKISNVIYAINLVSTRRMLRTIGRGSEQYVFFFIFTAT